jgi:putative transposase
MPRTARIAPSDWIFHVLNRRCGYGPLFEGPGCYARFLQGIADAAEADAMRILAFCLMPNHWHMLLRPRKDGDLARFLQRLTVKHVQHWHRSHETIGRGHLYQARYKSFPVRDDAHLLTVCGYIERNPVRAGLVAQAEDWAWSSARAHIACAQGGPELAVASACAPIRLAPLPIPLPNDWAKRIGEDQDPAELEATRFALLHDLPFGDAAWRETAAKRLGLRESPGKTGRRRATG